MPRPRNLAAFVLVGFCAWRVVACAPSKQSDSGMGVGGFYQSPFTGSGGGGGATTLGNGAGFGTAANGNNMGGAFLTIGMAGNAGNAREMDSSCHPVSETPEKITLIDSSVVTDTYTTLTPVAIFIMQDRSSSTVTGNPAPASPDSWKNSTDAVTAFVKDPMSVGLDIGLGVFPPMSNGTGDCNTGSDCGMPVVPIASLPNNATNIVNAYQTATPPANGLIPLFTPTECALRGMINTCLQYMAASPSGEKCVAVLVTDGTPTTCSTDEAALTQIIADGKTKGVDTYTLGLPGADTNILDQYAMAGGTMKSIDVTGGAQAFVQALNSIRGKVSHQTSRTVTMTKVVQTPLKCQWKIPAPKSMDEPPLDPKRVNVQFTAPGMPGMLFGHVPCDGQCSATTPPASCPPNGLAWYYDDEKTPTQVFLCPSTCNAIKNVLDVRVDLQFHCPQKPYIVM